MTALFRLLVVVLPVVAFVLTYYICHELRSGDRHPIKGSKITTVRRSASGGFESTEEEGGGFESVEEKLGI